MTAFRAFRLVVLLATILFNGFIYLYPDLLNKSDQCKWHEFDESSKIKPKNPVLNNLPTQVLEKLLLTFPSLQDNDKWFNNSTHSSDGYIKDIHMLTFGDPQINGNWPSTPYIKRFDNYGNDYYLGHIYNVMQRRLQPSHVAVMGDLFSSQWILDSEFYNRTLRFVERLFPRSLEYKKTVIDTHSKHENYDWRGWLDQEVMMLAQSRFSSRVYNDVYDWVYENHKYPNHHEPLFINLTGNHDIGYSGDATWQHMARFHHLFGQNNYVIYYNLNSQEQWRLVVLDSLTLEGPALQEEFVNYTWQFLDGLEETNKRFNGSTILLTHIPFYKEAGLCKDGPEHIYYENYEPEPYKNGKLRSQNHLSYDTSQKVLDIVFPNPDQGGIILTGHDHYGCDDWYNYDGSQWIASKQLNQTTRKSVREIVVQSMMGDFDGQTGLVSGHYDYNAQSWEFEFSYCSFVVQHWWWAAKALTVVTILLQSVGLLFHI
ncbi:hypothetical protein CANTEDRAFT_115415 [Yamadazyma tenuis ATCC 10573]|uniref:Calcineurin-like phosphoesterase domain-containing protein n=2 Tax=Candida tenuis TaxID=2315449 RepID=G3B9S9_CANTC|nr:uncharacterized protein CANTEDRAFT_115415 [Yamadazyma tenuis ATCC 10573]EGV61961.1 hypothetical protein CANTEDRAFT_115415 [Yamadazyma tenuis ATCC 10573]